jgi:hypothetical protein
MTISREFIKTEIDKVPEQDLEALHRIIRALIRQPQTTPGSMSTIVDWQTFVEQTYGSLASDPIVREPQGEYEIREDFE